jgi:hypothetical protein
MTRRNLIGVAALLAVQDKVAKPEDSAALARFLVKAKIEGYASGDQSRIHKLDDGGSEARFSEDPYSYRDRWYGESSFSGEEIVWRSGKPIWSLNFFSEAMKGVTVPADFPKFHKSALRHVTVEAPFRGPALYREGEFVYTNDVTGTIREFQGVEHVFFRSKEIFRLVYHGGQLLE